MEIEKNKYSPTAHIMNMYYLYYSAGSKNPLLAGSIPYNTETF